MITVFFKFLNIVINVNSTSTSSSCHLLETFYLLDFLVDVLADRTCSCSKGNKKYFIPSDHGPATWVPLDDMIHCGKTSIVRQQKKVINQ